MQVERSEAPQRYIDQDDQQNTDRRNRAKRGERSHDCTRRAADLIDFSHVLGNVKLLVCEADCPQRLI